MWGYLHVLVPRFTIKSGLWLAEGLESVLGCCVRVRMGVRVRLV